MTKKQIQKAAMNDLAHPDLAAEIERRAQARARLQEIEAMEAAEVDRFTSICTLFGARATGRS